MKKLIVVLLLALLPGCWPFPSWPHMEEAGTCRYFKTTTWGENKAPWNELEWYKEVVWIDEPMLPYWGWKGNPDDPNDVCGEKGLVMVRKLIADKRAEYPGALVWLNWSTDEIKMISRHCNGETWHQGADVFSFDSYGGVWDWEIRTRWLLDMFYTHASHEHRLGLIPEGHYCLTCGVAWEPIDYVQLGHLYFDWAMRHDDTGNIYAIAPFLWTSYPDMLGIQGQPQLVELYTNLQQKYPYCGP